MLPDCIIVLNLQEFSTVASAVTEQFPAYVSFVPMRNIPVEKLLELSHTIVRDPARILRHEPALPRQLLIPVMHLQALFYLFLDDWLQFLHLNSRFC